MLIVSILYLGSSRGELLTVECLFACLFLTLNNKDKQTGTHRQCKRFEQWHILSAEEVVCWLANLLMREGTSVLREELEARDHHSRFLGIKKLLSILRSHPANTHVLILSSVQCGES